MTARPKLSGEFILDPKTDDLDQKTEPKPEKNATYTPTASEKDVQPAQDLKPVANAPHNTKHKPHFFSSLVTFPDAVTFENQKDSEEILILVRRHFATNIPWIASFILFALAPLVLFPFLTTIFPFLELSGPTQTVAALFYYLVLFGFVLVQFTLWYFHVGLVTNIRIIDVDIHGILIRDVAETKLELIQDVSYTQVGVVRSIFGYGDVFIQTAGTNVNFEFDRVPEPAQIVQMIGSLIGKEEIQEG